MLFGVIAVAIFFGLLILAAFVAIKIFAGIQTMLKWMGNNIVLVFVIFILLIMVSAKIFESYHSTR
jgi:hypothetical protein